MKYVAMPFLIGCFEIPSSLGSALMIKDLWPSLWSALVNVTAKYVLDRGRPWLVATWGSCHEGYTVVIW